MAAALAAPVVAPVVAFQSLKSFIKTRKAKKAARHKQSPSCEGDDEDLLPGLETVPLLEAEDLSYQEGQELLTSHPQKPEVLLSRATTHPSSLLGNPEQRPQEGQENLLNFDEDFDIPDGGRARPHKVRFSADDQPAQETFREDGDEVVVPVTTKTFVKADSSEDAPDQTSSAVINPYLLEQTQDLLHQESISQNLSQPLLPSSEADQQHHIPNPAEAQLQSEEKRQSSSPAKSVPLIPGYKEKVLVSDDHDDEAITPDNIDPIRRSAETSHHIQDKATSPSAQTSRPSSLEQQPPNTIQLPSPEEEDSNSSVCK